ncbi:MAG TPA: hypothetical protein VE987_14155, partial [Polyangiaceae bacterium]|nr:hypothetical protein [Polyangiaceae bacterium]
STGQMPPMPNTAKTLIGANAAAAIVYPTAQDISNLFAWIMCLAADAGSPYASSYYGGDYGPATTSHADAGAAGAAAADAGGD